MKHIDASLLSSLAERMAYTQSFLGFDPHTDGALIQATKPILAPLLPTILDAVYAHLLSFDITAAPFAAAQAPGQESVDTTALHLEHDNIKYRKDFLRGYLVRLVSNKDWTPTSAFWSYLDSVGKAHQGKSAEESGLKSRKGKPPLFVEYRELALLLGWVENAVTDIVMGADGLELQTKIDVLKALNRYWWLQNDLFSKSYVREPKEIEA